MLRSSSATTDWPSPATSEAPRLTRERWGMLGEGEIGRRRRHEWPVLALKFVERSFL